jgi:hypothetical protein
MKTLIFILRALIGIILIALTVFISSYVVFGHGLWHKMSRNECLSHWSLKPQRWAMVVAGIPWNEHRF